MKKTTGILQLTDMDVGLFVSYELTEECLTTKLFRTFTLTTVPLKKVKDLREAKTDDVTRLNRINWLSSRRRLCPVYTLQTGEDSPRIFMRLARGSHIQMKHTLRKMAHAA
jgi:hypothetical protein